MRTRGLAEKEDAFHGDVRIEYPCSSQTVRVREYEKIEGDAGGLEDRVGLRSAEEDEDKGVGWKGWGLDPRAGG